MFDNTSQWNTGSDKFFKHNSSLVSPQISKILDYCKDAEGQNKIKMILSTVEIWFCSDAFFFFMAS